MVIKKPTEVVTPAMDALGVDFGYVRLKAGIRQSKLAYLDHGVSATEWLFVCDALCLDYESLLCGLDRSDQNRRIWVRWRYGLLDGLNTKEVRAIIRAERSFRFRRYWDGYACLGRRLRFKKARYDLVWSIKLAFWRNHNTVVLWLGRKLGRRDIRDRVKIVFDPFTGRFDTPWHRDYSLKASRFENGIAASDVKGLTCDVSEKGGQSSAGLTDPI